MLRKIWPVGLLCILVQVIPAQSVDQGKLLNRPIPEAAKQAFSRGMKLGRSDRYEAALAEFKKALELAPNYMLARAEYVLDKSYHFGSEAGVRAEYEALMAKEPENPVYPMALALGQPLAAADVRNARLEKVVELAPEWAWGHFAKAKLAEQTKPDVELTESLKTIDLAPDAAPAYTIAASALEKLKRFDEAEALATKLTANDDTRASGLLALWRIRLSRSSGSDEAKSKLKEELSRLAPTSKDLVTLTAVYSAYNTMLKDKDGAKGVEPYILRLDAKWYPERGTINISFSSDRNMMRRIVLEGWQAHLNNALRDIRSETDPKQRIVQLEALLKQRPGPDVRHDIQQRLLAASVIAKDLKRVLAYGDALLKDDPENLNALLSLAKALSDEKADHARALEYAKRALALTAEFHPAERSPEVDPHLFDALFSKGSQQEAYKVRRSEALDTYASLLSQAGKYKEAEDILKQALAVTRTEATLNALEAVDRQLGRTAEADKLAAEAKTIWMDKVRSGFKTEPAKDFEVSMLDGRKLKLSDLRGKTVLISFWATWCVPCREEMPLLVELYKKYKDQGLEIVAISSDLFEDRAKVVEFAKQYNLTFPVTLDTGPAKTYGVSVYPTTYFIDQQGRVRYQTSGFDSKNGARELEFVVDEIFKTGHTE